MGVAVDFIGTIEARGLLPNLVAVAARLSSDLRRKIIAKLARNAWHAATLGCPSDASRAGFRPEIVHLAR
jgi:hypothetical protein